MSMMAFNEITSSFKKLADKMPDFSKKLGADLSKDSIDVKQAIVSDDRGTRNSGLEGKNHPITGVPYERKIVEIDENIKFEGVFPVFDSKFDAKLPEDKLQASDNQQFKESNNQLKDWVENNESGAKKIFDSEQLEDIINGKTPEGCTWHHSESKGVMQLVDTEIHAKTAHTGGKTIWGGGNENR